MQWKIERESTMPVWDRVLSHVIADGLFGLFALFESYAHIRLSLSRFLDDVTYLRSLTF